MIHIVFQQKDVEVLGKAIELDESLAGEIVEIKDDYAVGSIHQLDTGEGWQQRQDWWKSLLAVSPYEDNTADVDDRLTLEGVQHSLEENNKEIVWIWMGQNSHDVCGYYWLISRLKPYMGRIFVLYMNNLPFINEKGQIFYPTTLHQIQPKEFIKAKKLNRAITASEFEVDPDEWIRLTDENAMIRVLEGGKKIESKEAQFYDQDILNGLSGEWQKGHKAMTHILGKMKIKTGDVFLLWRMRELAEEGKIELVGDPANGWKEFEVRLKHPSPAAMIEPGNIQL